MKVSIDDLDPKDLLFTRTYEVIIEIFKTEYNKSLVVAITTHGSTQYEECFTTDEIDTTFKKMLPASYFYEVHFYETHYERLLLAVDYYFKKMNK